MPLLATIFSTGLLALALPNEIAPYGIALLGLVCLVPYFTALAHCRSYRDAALLGAVFGALSHAATSYWLVFFQDFAVWTIGATSVAYGLLHAILAVFLRRFSLGPRMHPKSGLALRPATNPLRPFLIAAVWTVWEWQKSIGFLGYPWGLVAYAVNEVSPLIQIADSLGVYGLTFLLALANALISEANLYRRAMVLHPVSASTGSGANGFIVLGTLSVWFLVYGAWVLAHPTPIVDRVPFVLVQHNGDSWETGGEIQVLKTCQALSREGIARMEKGDIALAGNGTSGAGSAAGMKPALVVWSETVLRRPFEDYRPFFRKSPPNDPFIPFLADIDTPLLTGAPVVLDWERYDATNSALLISSRAEVIASYAKSHPVPFAEAIPFWEYQWMRDFMKDVVGLEGGWVVGTEATVMEIETPSGRPLHFGVPICFEDAFADVCADFYRNGADILINITNDSWSKTVSSETQHLVASRFRAVENRRVLVRSTNGGVTSVVDAEGRMIASLPLFTEASLPVLVPIQISSAPTTYFLLGDWFPVLMAALVLAFLLFDALAGVRKRSRGHNPV